MTIAQPLIGDDVQFVSAAPTKHPLRSTIQHWQLRDLVCCPTSRHEVLYVHGNNVSVYNASTKVSTPILKDLAFPPTCISAGLGYLVVGGQRSQLLVRSLTSSWFTQHSVGACINNALVLTQNPNGPAGSTRLLACNNDESIKVFDLPSMQRVANLTLPTAVNYAAVSPDGVNLAAVGDSNQVFLYSAAGSASYARTSTITVPGSSAGFSCSWNPTGDKFAIASQDGLVLVYDHRAPTTPMATFMSTVPASDRGAVRCVKWSPSSAMDLLAFTEHVSHVHFVDARNFNERQVVRVCPRGSEAHITGMSFSPDSRTVFVGTEAALLEFEVNSRARRSFPAGGVL
ncbi:WD40-repeat-containing domain protein [Blastocladiella britannica]|nr:WD40-repeat-containing domain protein [Blastocladiella britannica]